MDSKIMLPALLDRYRSSFDVEENYEVEDVLYDAHAAFNVTSAKYVLVKRAQLWQANSFEHVFFRRVDSLLPEHLEQFSRHLRDHFEPTLVCGGQKYPPKNHMYTFVTGIFLCDGAFSKEAVRKLKHMHFYKNYLFSVRGYCQLRLMAVDCTSGTVIGNSAADELVKEYKRTLKSFYKK